MTGSVRVYQAWKGNFVFENKDTAAAYGIALIKNIILIDKSQKMKYCMKTQTISDCIKIK